MRAIFGIAPAFLVGCSFILGIGDVPVPTDAASDATSTLALQCAATTCDDPSAPVCCLSVCGASQDSFCAPDGGACTSSCVITVTCDRNSECPAPLVCCGAYDSLDKSLLGASCEPLGGCQQGEHRVFCSPSDPTPCPQNAACGTSDAGGFEPYAVCLGL